jgi:hypothetical protein
MSIRRAFVTRNKQKSLPSWRRQALDRHAVLAAVRYATLTEDVKSETALGALMK